MSMSVRGGQRSGSRRGDGVSQQENDNRQRFNNLRMNHQIHNKRLGGNKNMQNGGRNMRNNMVPIKKVLTNKKTGAQFTVVAKTGRAALIAKNLEHMNQAAQKKRAAQEHYYGQGRSPMVKTSSGPFVKQESSRVSVQHRLGIYNKSNQFANNNVMRSEKFNRIQKFQRKRQRTTNKNPNQAFKTVSSTGKVLYLKPVRSSQQIRPTNYTVCVENHNNKAGVRTDNLFNVMPYKHHVSTDLNPAIQQEIRILQNKIRPMEVALPPNISVMNVSGLVDAKLPIVATKTTLHERFSMI